jgi:hypothetical protein
MFCDAITKVWETVKTLETSLPCVYHVTINDGCGLLRSVISPSSLQVRSKLAAGL